MINYITLGELTATTRPICYGVLKPGKLDPNGIPLIRVTDISSNFFNDSNLYKISPDLDKEFSRSKLKGGEVLLSIQGTVGRVAICPIEYAGANISRTIAVIEPDQRVLKDYLKFYFIHMDIEGKHYSTGSTRASLNISYLRKLKIPLPSLDHQKKIASILDAADAYKQKTKALIEKYDELTQSLFLDMFGDPVRNPKEWNLFTFKDVLEIRNGKNQKTIENENGIYPICGSGGIMCYGDDYISEANSVIIGRKGNINKPILMKEKYWHVDTAFGLNPIKKILGHDYLYWFCVRYNFEQHNKTVTIPSLTKETLLRIKIPTPPIELQNQFADRVQAIEAQKAQAQASLAQAEDLFNSLLQRAFKGELV